MKLPVGLTAVLLLAAASAQQLWEEMDEDTLYRYIFDDVDVDGIILNDRVLDVYLRCFFRTGPCTSLAGAIRAKIPEVFSTVCGKCTMKQKKIWRHALGLFIPRRPKDWEHILEMYDPTGEYWPRIKEFMADPQYDEWPLKE